MITFGSYEWIVLDIQDNTAFIITQDIIEQHAFHDAPADVTWADCALRKYLNGEFYDRFTNAEKANIISVTNKNPDNPWYGAKGGNDTEDKIFLLTIEDVVCKYFGDSSKLLYDPGKNQKYWFQRKDVNNCKRRACYDGHIWWWWLRSPGRANKRAVYIHGDGNIGIQGNGTFRYNSNIIHPSTGDNCGGVRPVLWLRVES